MSTIKSSAENLTLNADGSGNDVLIQSNGSTKAIVTAEGALGIGMSPVKTLDVNSGSGANVARFTSTAAEASIQIVNDARTWSWGVRDISSNTNAAFIHDNGASADRLVISTAGVVSIPVGIELGSGVDGTAANTLDDYEEGTWTPAIKFGGNAASFATSLNVGFYTKIGNFVHWCFRTTITNKGSSTGNCSVAGLPFACASTTGNFGGAHIVFSQNWTADAGMSEEHNQCVIDSGSSSVMLRRIATNGGFNSTTNTQFTNSTQIIMKGEYRVS